MEKGILEIAIKCILHTHSLWFVDSEIRFRVVAETLTDTSPTGPNSESSDSHLDAKDNKQIPYLITVCSYSWLLLSVHSPYSKSLCRDLLMSQD